MDGGRILIISTNAVGDAYLSLAALSAIREAMPGAYVEMIAGEKAAFLLRWSQLDFVRYLRSHDVGEVIGMLRDVHRSPYDCAASFFGGRADSILLLGTKAPRKAGFLDILGKKEWHHRDVPLSSIGCGRSERIRWSPNMLYLDRVRLVLTALGIPTSALTKPTFPACDSSIPRKRGSHAILHAQSRVQEKSLPPSLTAALIRHIRESIGSSVVVIGAGASFNRSLPPKSAAGEYEVLADAALPDLLHAILTARIFIGVDSLPLHLADAYGIPFVGLFSVTRPASALVHPENAIHLDVPSFETLSAAMMLQRLDQLLAQQPLP